MQRGCHVSPSARRRHAHTELRKDLYAAVRHALDPPRFAFPGPSLSSPSPRWPLSRPHSLHKTQKGSRAVSTPEKNDRSPRSHATGARQYGKTHTQFGERAAAPTCPLGRSPTTTARLFGKLLGPERGKPPQIHAIRIRQAIRSEFGPQHIVTGAATRFGRVAVQVAVLQRDPRRCTAVEAPVPGERAVGHQRGLVRGQHLRPRQHPDEACGRRSSTAHTHSMPAPSSAV